MLWYWNGFFCVLCKWDFIRVLKAFWSVYAWSAMKNVKNIKYEIMLNLLMWYLFSGPIQFLLQDNIGSLGDTSKWWRQILVHQWYEDTMYIQTVPSSELRYCLKLCATILSSRFIVNKFLLRSFYPCFARSYLAV